jgi:hypothetical protein
VSDLVSFNVLYRDSPKIIEENHEKSQGIMVPRVRFESGSSRSWLRPAILDLITCYIAYTVCLL